MEIRYGRKRSGIKREIKAKIEDWLSSIDNEEVRKIAEKNVIVTGGCIASMLLGEKINDFDLYFRTKEATIEVAKYYVNVFNKTNSLDVDTGVTNYAPIVKEESIKNIKGEVEDRVCIYMKSAGVASENQDEYKYFELQSDDSAEAFAESLITEAADDTKGKYRPIFLSQNAITLSNKLQIIIRFFGEPDKIHSNYDFVHAMCYYDYKENELLLPAEALEALLSRTLIYKGSLYPIASIFRMKKFLERGWRITAGQQLKIMWQISEIDLTNKDVLYEQLTGVDMAYMWQLIDALKSVEPEKINSAYVSVLLDRIFE
ncbi:MAG: hypothetical protein ACXW2E_01845 [Nitrososphaeraceae archaeon]